MQRVKKGIHSSFERSQVQVERRMEEAEQTGSHDQRQTAMTVTGENQSVMLNHRIL